MWWNMRTWEGPSFVWLFMDDINTPPSSWKGSQSGMQKSIFRSIELPLYSPFVFWWKFHLTQFDQHRGSFLSLLIPSHKLCLLQFTVSKTMAQPKSILCWWGAQYVRPRGVLGIFSSCHGSQIQKRTELSCTFNYQVEECVSVGVGCHANSCLPRLFFSQEFCFLQKSLENRYGYHVWVGCVYTYYPMQLSASLLRLFTHTIVC